MYEKYISLGVKQTVWLEREADTLSQDCWDAVSFNTKSKQLNFVRFGAGEDKVIKY